MFLHNTTPKSTTFARLREAYMIMILRAKKVKEDKSPFNAFGNFILQ